MTERLDPSVVNIWLPEDLHAQVLVLCAEHYLMRHKPLSLKDFLRDAVDFERREILASLDPKGTYTAPPVTQESPYAREYPRRIQYRLSRSDIEMLNDLLNDYNKHHHQVLSKQQFMRNALRRNYARLHQLLHGDGSSLADSLGVGKI